MSRKERLKVYHGMPKSTTDEHTVFYASFDGAIEPEVGCYTEIKELVPAPYLTPFCTGYGLVGKRSNISGVTLPKSGTIDFWLDSTDAANVIDIAGARFYMKTQTELVFQFRSYPTVTNVGFSVILKQNINHIRLVYSNANNNFVATAYINGALVYSNFTKLNWQMSLNVVPLYPSSNGIFFGTNTGGSNENGCTFVISDFHISNIDRGDYFPNLPQDFIEGKAIIKPRMGQQQIKGDPMYSQETTDVIKIGTNVNEPYIACSRTSGNWTNGDTIKIKGLSGEIITGKDSASPIVKSSTGTNITGSWSNLGTNEATFTLGTNSSLTNQDLYVTYSLNIPAGNSDFTELPYSIEKVYDVVGNELVEVSEIVIEDDFYGKVAGSLKECPHISKFATTSTTLVNPSSFTNEANDTAYRKLYSNTTESNINISTTAANAIPQQLFSFNLIKLVEDKIGKIPSIDKIQWLKDNIIHWVFYWYGYGTYPTGNLAKVTVYKTNRWDTWYDANDLVTSSSVTMVKRGTSDPSVISQLIQQDGFAHLLAYTNASNETTSSTIYTNYVKLEIKLKNDNTFTTFYSENKRARENPCNPVLIQKKTKSVKRYLPTKECFSTEILNYGYKTNHIEGFCGKVLSTQNDKIVTSNGTGSYISGINGDIDYSDKVPIPSTTSKTYEFNNELLNIYSTDNVGNCSHSVRLPIVRYWGGKQYVGVGDSNSGIDSCATLTGDFDNKNYNLYEFFGQLRESNKELYLTVQSTKRIQGNKGLPPIGLHWTYKLPNRPLIK